MRQVRLIVLGDLLMGMLEAGPIAGFGFRTFAFQQVEHEDIGRELGQREIAACEEIQRAHLSMWGIHGTMY